MNLKDKCQRMSSPEAGSQGPKSPPASPLKYWQPSTASRYPITRDRVLEAERDAAGQFRPKPVKKSKPVKEQIKEAPAQEAGKAPEGIQSTKEYSLFKFLPTNRPVDPSHVNRLAAEIRKKNLLNLNPITVNSSYEVIDGQHRLKAAEKVGVTIFFIQNDEVTQDDIASLNSNKKNWAMQNYLHFYAEQGSQDYISFLELCKANPSLQPGVLLSMCAATGKKSGYKDGHLDLSNMESARQVINYLADFDGHTNQLYSTRFVEAVSFMVRTGLYDHAQMIKKLEANPGALQPCATTKDYIVMLERIYNKNIPEKNVVIFLKKR